MKIEYFGHSCFRLTNAEGVSIVTDPYTKVGYELPKNLTADVITVSHNHFDHNYVMGVKGAKKVVDSVGYTLVEGVSIIGAETWHDPKQGALRGNNLIFTIEMDGLKVCHFGDLGEEYSEKIEQIIKDADVWLLPIGGTYTIDAEQAKKYVEKLNPKCVIPMHYLPSDGRLDIAGSESFLQRFSNAEISYCLQGEAELFRADIQNAKTKILYMERKQG
ncbi:MAG: MBL fold metallo-hydrolase [Clostridia bacterium]|nr:MBL fold metallo-hydrolase [Clostridia bacterium]